MKPSMERRIAELMDAGYAMAGSRRSNCERCRHALDDRKEPELRSCGEFEVAVRKLAVCNRFTERAGA